MWRIQFQRGKAGSFVPPKSGGTTNEKSEKQEQQAVDDSESIPSRSEEAAAKMQIEPVPKIPWFRANRSNPAWKIEESKYFKVVMEHGDEKRGRLNLVLYKIFNECFPYYIPKMVHCMDFSQVAKQEDVVNKIGKVVTHFVISNVAHGLQLQVNLVDAVTSLESNDSLETFERLLTYLKGLRGWLEPGFEKCEDPADFLLEPWVLIQLPFHPAVAHQWLVAAWAEYLSFRKRIAFLRFMRLPLEVIPLVDQLFRLSLVLLANLFTTLGTFERLMQLKQDPCDPNVLDWFLEVYCVSPFLANTVPIIQFLLSRKCQDMINYLKRQAWNSSTCDQKCFLSEFVPAFEVSCGLDIDMAHLYSYKFWMNDNMKHIFGTVASKQLSASNPKQHKDKSGKKKKKKTWLPFEDPKTDEKVDLVLLGQFIEDRILAPGWLKGISKEELLVLIEKSCCHLRGKLFAAYHRFKWFEETSEGICAEDSGVQHDLMNLTSEAEAEEALAVFIESLCCIAKSATIPSAKRIYLEAVDCDGPQFSISEIEKTISGVRKSKKWSMHAIFAKIQQQCPPPSGSPPVDLSDPEMLEDEDFFKKVMASFEARVKHIALTMYKGQLGIVTRKEKRKFYLELQVVQYILPWVVTSIWQLFDQQKKSDQKNRNLWHFVWFVHSLISQYEDEKCHFVTNGSPKSFYNLLMLSNLEAFLHALKTKCQLMTDYCKLIFDTAKPFNEKVFSILTEPFSFFIGSLDVLKHDKQWQGNFKNLAQYSYRLISKVCLALEKTAKHCQIRLFSFPDSLMYGKLSDALNLLCNLALNTLGISHLFKQFEKHMSDVVFRVAELRAAHINGLISKEDLAFLKYLEADRMFSVFSYVAFTNTVPRKKQIYKEALQLSQNPLDSLEEGFNAYMKEDWWKLKQLLAKWRMDRGFRSPNLVSLEHAKRDMNLYGGVLSALGKDNKVKMENPGEITFFPIKHCHWCGLVDCPEFRICQLCKESEDYLDKIMFCSEKCELQAMEGFHGEDHCRFIEELMTKKFSFM